MPKRPSRPRQFRLAYDAADGGGVGRGAQGSQILEDIPPGSAPGGCEVARAMLWTCLRSDAQNDGILRIWLAAVSDGRRAALGMAGPFASRYETRHGHAPRMRELCWSHDVSR